jgi:hypothetical protein
MALMTVPMNFRAAMLRQANRKRLGFGGGTSTSTQSSDPWSGQQPYLTGLFQQAQNQYSNYTPQYFGYTGTSGGTPTQTGPSTVSPFNSAETGALAGIENTGMNGTPALNAANSSVSNILSGDPAMEQSIAAGVVPGLESQFTQGNSVNNPAMAYATSNGLYNALLQNQLNAAGTANTLYNTGMAGQEAALGAGQTAQTQSQNELQNQVNAYNYYQQLPYSQINQLSNLITGQYGGTTTTSQPNPGLFGSLFSDRRLKDSIRRIGTADNGLPIYAFTYKGDKTCKTHLGFMADEVELVHPEAVFKLSSGHAMVRYDLAVRPAKEKVV